MCVTTHRGDQIGTAVRISRIKSGMTQGALAERCGCSRMTIITIEHGASNPGYFLAYILASVLGFDMNSTVPNTTPSTCLCHLFGPAECRVCYPKGYAQA